MDNLKEHMLKCLRKGIRYDGRKMEDYRKITVEYGISKSAEGSARVCIGETEVLAGVKMGVESPYPDTPEKGNLMINAELLGMSNPAFEPGPPGEQAIEMARVVDRGIRESEAIDNKKLCLVAGESVWSVMIDICTINDAGNLIDAGALASMAALKNTRFPALKENNKVDYSAKTETPLPLLKTPITVTVYKIGEFFIVDPTPQEELVFDARLTVVSTEDSMLCAMQKGGDAPLAAEEIDKMVGMGIAKANEIRNCLQ